jgi:transposase
MKTNVNHPLFSEEQLNNMSRDNLMELIKIQNVHTLKLEKHMESLENEVRVKTELVKELEFLNALLNDKLTLAQKQHFGASSEKNKEGYEQFSLFNEAELLEDSDLSEPEYEEVHPSAYKRKKTKGKKENDLSKFPVRRIEHKLSREEQICKECGAGLKVVSTEVHRYLNFVPAHFETVEEVVYVYSCSKCDTMVRAPKDPSLLKGSIATPSLVAAVMNAKYVNGVPLYRQSQEFRRYDLNLTDKTMANWMIRCSEVYLYPIYERMKQELLKGHYSHCDETRIQVLDEPDQKAETQNWMWVYMTDELSESPLMVLFQYERTRGGYHPANFLENYHGYLTTDGYQPYHNLPDNIIVTGCMAHSRRRFDKCLTALKKDFTKEQLKGTIAYEALSRIAILYKMEETLAGKSPEERHLERQRQVAPVLDALFEWLHTMKTPDLDHKSLLGDAILYTLGQEKYLRRYIEDGHLAIDNNACERSLKTFACGRRAWLFAKSIYGAEASAVIYSITETAKLNGLRPYSYLTYLLETMKNHQADTNYDFIDTLLPWSKELPEECKTSIPLKQQ